MFDKKSKNENNSKWSVEQLPPQEHTNLNRKKNVKYLLLACMLFAFVCVFAALISIYRSIKDREGKYDTVAKKLNVEKTKIDSLKGIIDKELSELDKKNEGDVEAKLNYLIDALKTSHKRDTDDINAIARNEIEKHERTIKEKNRKIEECEKKILACKNNSYLLSKKCSNYEAAFCQIYNSIYNDKIAAYSDGIIDDIKNRITQRRREMTELNKNITKLEKEKVKLSQQIKELQNKIKKSEAELKSLRSSSANKNKDKNQDKNNLKSLKNNKKKINIKNKREKGLIEMTTSAIWQEENHILSNEDIYFELDNDKGEVKKFYYRNRQEVKFYVSEKFIKSNKVNTETDPLSVRLQPDIDRYLFIKIEKGTIIKPVEQNMPYYDRNCPHGWLQIELPGGDISFQYSE